MSQGCALLILRSKGQRSRSWRMVIWKWFPDDNWLCNQPMIMKLHTLTHHESRMCPIDFGVKRSTVKVMAHGYLKMVHRNNGCRFEFVGVGGGPVLLQQYFQYAFICCPYMLPLLFYWRDSILSLVSQLYMKTISHLRFQKYVEEELERFPFTVLSCNEVHLWKQTNKQVGAFTLLWCHSVYPSYSEKFPDKSRFDCTCSRMWIFI